MELMEEFPKLSVDVSYERIPGGICEEVHERFSRGSLGGISEKKCERNSGEISEKKNVLEFQKQFKQDFQKLIPRRFSKEISTAVSQAFHIRFLD